MRNLRNCESAEMNSGSSACPVNWGQVKGAILVEHGQKLPAKITSEALEQLCHADRPKRIYPILPFVEYGKNGGEAQVSAVGYGPTTYNGLSAQTDNFTMGRFDEILNAELLKCAGKEWDVYYWDSNYMLIGYNDGTDVLAGIPMASVYPGSTPFSTSSAKSSMTVNFSHKDAEDDQLHYDYVKLDFNPATFIKGLVECLLVEDTSSNYRIIEKVGGYDRTAEFATTFAAAVSSIMEGAQSGSVSNGLIKITGSGPLKVKAPSVLYENQIKFIEIEKVIESA